MSLSAADVKYELESLRPNLFLDETEDTWEKIGKSVTSLIKLCENGGYDANPTEFVAALRAAHRPIISAMNSERTRLSLIPLEFFSTLAPVMGGEFEQLLPLFMQPLLNLCTRTNKVVLNRSRACIFSIIESSQSASLLTYFLQNIKDKSNTLKTVASEGTLACLNSCNPPDLERESRAIEIEAIIRATARDAHADVRKVSRKLFESYKILLPSRVANFTAPLSPTTKKYLDIKAATVQSKPVSNMRSTGHVNKPPVKPEVKKSNPSTSAPSTSSTRHVPGRSVSATLSTTTINSQTRQPATALTKVARKEPSETPATSYAPVRPVQPARIVADAQTTLTQRRIATGGPARSAVPDDHKRPAPPMRAQSSTMSRATGAGAASSAGAHRLQLNSAAPVATASGSQSTFSGPRRVPMPVPAPIPVPESAPAPPKDKESLKPPVSKAGTTASFKPRPAVAPAAPAKSKPTSTLPSAKERLPTANPTQTKVRPASAAAHNVAGNSTASSSTTTRPLAVAKAKPQWGRSAVPPKAAPVPQKTTTLTRKPSSRILPRAAAPVKKRPVTPAMVALPPSPTPEVNDADAEDAAEIPAKIIEQPQEVIEERQATTPLPQPDAPQEQQQDEEPAATPVQSESVPMPEGHSESREEDDGRTSPSTANNQDAASAVPASTGGPQTPQGLLPLPPSSQAAFAAKTPISALLSSIERGFTYSPNTPLSPAELYLPNDSGATPYSHQTHAQAQGPRQPFNYALHAPDAAGVFAGFAFGTKKEEELVCGDIGVIKVSDHNKLFSQIGMDDATARHAFIEVNH